MPVTGSERVRLYHAERVNDLYPHGGEMKLRMALREALTWQGVQRIRVHIGFIDADYSDLVDIGEVERCARELGIT